MTYEMYTAGMLVDELQDAGLIEVYEALKENMGNRHTDSIGEYKGDDLKFIPEGAFIEYSTLDAEEYSESVLANCSGDGEDYVSEETGKVLIVQYFIPEGNFDEHYVIEVPHTSPVKWWSCESFWDTAINNDELDYQEFSTLADAKEFFEGMDIPDELADILTAGKEAIAVRRYNDDDWQFFNAAEFDKESYAREFFARDLNCMIVLDDFEEAYSRLANYPGHKADEVRNACREIIERASW